LKILVAVAVYSVNFLWFWGGVVRVDIASSSAARVKLDVLKVIVAPDGNWIHLRDITLS